MTHSILAPSFAPVWVHCTAAPLLAMQCPEQESQDAAEGNAAHWVAAQILDAYRNGNDIPQLLGAVDPAGTLVDDDIFDSACVYAEDVMFHCNRLGQRDHLFIEQHVHADAIHREAHGTLDAAWVGPNMIVLWDFKHGHREIDHVWNWQLLTYLSGMLTLLQINGLDDQNLRIQFRIAQPRCYTSTGPIRTFEFTASDARAYLNRLRNSAEEALSDRATLTPGGHCKFCPAVHVCSAPRRVEMFGADFAGQPVPDAITANGLSFELSILKWMIPILEKRLEALETEALARQKQGEFIPGFTVDQKLGQRKFLSNPIDYGKLLGVDLTQSDKPVTGAEAERRMKAAGLDPETLLAGMVERPQLGPKLVPAKDSRAIRVFTQE